LSRSRRGRAAATRAAAKHAALARRRVELAEEKRRAEEAQALENEALARPRERIPDPLKPKKSDPQKARKNDPLVRIAIRVIGAQLAIAGALASGIADVVNNGLAELIRVKPIPLEHETFGQVVILMAIIALTGLAFAFLRGRQPR
jgi:hypothetical protein